MHLDLQIGVVNGYDLETACNYYLIIRWIDNDIKMKYLSIDRVNNSDNPKNIAEKFKNELLNFIFDSFMRYLTPIEKRFIRPNLFDLYDKNLNKLSIENDEKLKNKLIEFNHLTHDFVKHLNYSNYYAFTEFVIKNNFLFDKTDDEIKVVNNENIITANQNYKASISRLKNFYFDEEQRRNYELDNFSKLEKVEYLIQ